MNIISNELKNKILKMYTVDNLTYREIKQIIKCSNADIASIVKGLATSGRKKSIRLKLGITKITDSDRIRMSEMGKRSCKRTGKIWTKPEREFKNILNELNIGVIFPSTISEIFRVKSDINGEILFQYPVQRYLCDFVDINNKIVYNVNGDFWHGNPILYKNGLTAIQHSNRIRDNNKKIFLEKHGWLVCDIWESEIYWNRELVKFKIIESRAKRKLVNPSALHADFAGFDPQFAHQQWNEKIKDLWFSKNKRKQRKKNNNVCTNCGKIFETYYGSKIRQFCSQECSHVGRRKVKRPSIEQLKKDISELPFTKIGKKYNVSDNAVRKWARTYSIMPP